MINYYIYIFFTCSILGWFGEVIWRYLFTNKVVNPGSLIGPWCPIYGVAGVLIFLISSHKHKIYINFFKISFISILVEYISAYISEEFFNHRI